MPIVSLLLILWLVRVISSGVVNPAKINAFAKSELSRARTDKADGKLIARYAATLHPPIPPPENIRRLQALVRRVEYLLEMIQMGRNRLGDSLRSDPIDSAPFYRRVAKTS
jgi:transposase